MREALDAAAIKRLVADISRHDEAAPLILSQGRAAVPALDSFLAGAPSSVPHARRFAIAMLALIPGAEATAALRRSLHRHALAALAPDVAQAEWLVQNDAFAALAARPGVSVTGEISYGLEVARLPATVATIGRLKLAERIPALVALLSDDILEHAAREALPEFGERAVPALTEAIREPARDVGTLKRTLAALELLADLPARAETAAALRALLIADVHPAIKARTALVLRRTRTEVPAKALADALANGALLTDLALVEGCLEALADLDPASLATAGKNALARETIPDAYGVPCPVADAARARLLASIGDHFTGSLGPCAAAWSR